LFRKDQVFKNRVKIGFGNDISLDFQISDDFTITKMKAQFMKYFKFAMVQTQGSKNSEGMNDCAEDCGKDFSKNLCCTTIEMFGKGSTKDFVQYQCMDTSVADLSTGIWLGEYYYELECQNGEWDGDRDRKTFRTGSGAASLAAGILSMAVLISLA
jgi:hypothetical protein